MGRTTGTVAAVLRNVGKKKKKGPTIREEALTRRWPRSPPMLASSTRIPTRVRAVCLVNSLSRPRSESLPPPGAPPVASVRL